MDKTYRHKEYSCGIRVQSSILEAKHKFRSVRYRGRGRPRLEDYDYKSLLEIMKDIDTVYNKWAAGVFKNSF